MKIRLVRPGPDQELAEVVLQLGIRILEKSPRGSGRSSLTERQNTVLQLIRRGCTQRVAAERAGVSPRTVTRWKKDPWFREAVAAARSGGG